VYSRVLVPLDGSRPAEAVLAELPHVTERAGQVRLLSVIRYPVYDWLVTDPALGAMVAADMEHVRRHAGAYLEQVAASLRCRGFQVTCELHSGPVADTILDAARCMQADLIVMSTHGRGGLGRLLLGSVSARVLQRALMPVLLVQPRVLTAREAEGT
jgi:nucleotide-binding universal stress UspA family protein